MFHGEGGWKEELSVNHITECSLKFTAFFCNGRLTSCDRGMRETMVLARAPRKDWTLASNHLKSGFVLLPNLPETRAKSLGSSCFFLVLSIHDDYLKKRKKERKKGKMDTENITPPPPIIKIFYIFIHYFVIVHWSFFFFNSSISILFIHC